MSRVVRFLKNPPVTATLLILVILAGWSIWNAQASQGRMSPGVKAALARGDATLDLVVQMDFKVEAYHINFFQGRGRVARVQDQQISLRRVPAAEVPSMARHYWIARIALPSEVS